MRISEMINQLRLLKSEFGDRQVVLSADEEGNSFGSTNIRSFGVTNPDPEADNCAAIVVYPYLESLSIKELVDFEENNREEK